MHQYFSESQMWIQVRSDGSIKSKLLKFLWSIEKQLKIVPLFTNNYKKKVLEALHKNYHELNNFSLFLIELFGFSEALLIRFRNCFA